VKNPKHDITVGAFSLFRRLGFKNVTMDDVARSMGISKKTLYEHFTDKDELVLAAVQLMLNENQQLTDEAFKAAKNAVDEIIKILIIMEQMVRGLNLVCYHDLQRYYPEAYQYLQSHKESYLYECISKNLQEGIEQGLYRDDLDVDIISRFRMESAMLVFQNDLFPQEKFSAVKVSTQIFSHYMYGIATLKGYKLISAYLNKLNK